MAKILFDSEKQKTLAGTGLMWGLMGALLAMISGCGAQTSYRSSLSKYSSSGSQSDFVFDNGGSDNGSSGDDTANDDGGDDEATGTSPVYSTQVRGVGYTEQTFTVSAGRVLKVTFQPGIQDSTVSGSGVSPQYSRLGVYITVGSQTQNTPMLRNGLLGLAEKSGVLDFSSAAASLTGCTADDPNCRGDVTITISRPNYDYWCLNFLVYCPWNHVSDTHPWNGTLKIQTDDTVAVE